MRAAFWALLLCLPACLAASAADAPPNVLLVLADDQRFDTIRALGNAEIETPQLDRLVERGFVFRNAYCMGSMVPAVCMPSRTMLLTGRSLWNIPENPRAQRAPPGVSLLPTVMSGAGYRTFHSGKAGNSCTFAHAAFDINHETNRRTADSATEHADAAIDFLRSHDGRQPFFIYLAPPVPHDPRLAPAAFADRYDPARLTLSRNFLPRHPFDNGELEVRDELLAPLPRNPADMRRHLAEYYATISHLDHELGRVLAAIQARGWSERTVVIFTSDQGLAVGGRHGLMGKQNLYEHFKSPLVMAGPGIRHGETTALVYLFDLFPTLCALAGAPAPPEVEGENLLPLIQGKQAATREYLLCAYRQYQRMVRDARWKRIDYDAGGQQHAQLFDLEHDPDELVNLADDPRYAAEFARLGQAMARLRREYHDPVTEFQSKGQDNRVRAGSLGGR